MDYKKIYDNLVNTRLSRGLDKSKLTGYYEKHHIVPKCLGGKNNKKNYVLFTYKEHILAHRLLALIYPNEKKLLTALFLMITVKIDECGNKVRVEKSTKELVRIKAKFIKQNSGENHPMFGKHQTEESKRKNSESQKGEKGHFFGKHHTEHSKRLISESQKGEKSVHYGVSLPEEQRERISESLKGRTPWNKGKVYSVEEKERIYGNRKPPKKRPPMKEETKKKISESLKGEKSVWWGRKHSEEELLKMSAWQKGVKKGPLPEKQKEKMRLNSSTRKQVEGPDGTIYLSIKECARINNLTRSTLQRWINECPEKGYKII